MFAKVFGQIFDSSIAEDYNCRRMFMDLLVLADSDGVIDMTHEAISRRTNVPVEEVRKYISELQQPDKASRSKLHEGKRLIPVDPDRDWGWQIVNYRHYRQIRDEDARRSYFREQKQKQRVRDKQKHVKDIMVDTGGHCKTVPSPSSSVQSTVLKDKAKPSTREEVLGFVREQGLPETDGHYFWDKWLGNGFKNSGLAIKDWRAVIRSHKMAGWLPSQKQHIGGSSFQKPGRAPTEREMRLDRERKEAEERLARRKAGL